MFVADGQFPVVDALDVRIDDLPKVERKQEVGCDVASPRCDAH